MQLHHPEHLQVVCEKNMTAYRAPQRVEPALHREFNDNKDSVEALNTFPYLRRVENVVHLESELRLG